MAKAEQRNPFAPAPLQGLRRYYGRLRPYYVSRPLITKDQTESSTGLRIPAVGIEQLVNSRLRQWLLDPGCVYNAARLADPAAQRRLLVRARELSKSWPELSAPRQRALLTALVERIDFRADRVEIRLSPRRLGALLGVAAPTLPCMTDEATQILSVPVQLHRCGREIKMLVHGTDPFAVKPDARLIKLLIKARRFNAALVGSDGVPFAAVAKSQGVSPSYFTRLVRLSYLAPDITQAILDGRQPPDLSSDKLLAHSRLPLAWQDQRNLLGFA